MLNDAYILTCPVCGKKFRSLQRPKKPKACFDCNSIEKGRNDLYAFATKEDRFDEAVYRIKNMVRDFPKYDNAIRSVHGCLHHEAWFQSTEEVMAGIEFMKNQVRTIHQQKIGRYKVDFVLPEYKALVEIDGRIYHSDKYREGKRDGMILLTIGTSWHMVRIDTDLVNSNIRKLLPAVKAVIEEQNSNRLRYSKI